MVERRKSVRIVGLHDREPEKDLDGATPAERLSMVWPVTLNAWAFKEETLAESRLQRHSVRVLKSLSGKESEAGRVDR
jgi:hypothetical protein